MTTRFPSWDIETQNRILAEARREQAKVFAKYLRLAFTGVAHLVTAVFQSIARAVVQASQSRNTEKPIPSQRSARRPRDRGAVEREPRLSEDGFVSRPGRETFGTWRPPRLLR